MSELRVRPMTAAEFDAFRRRAISEYAAAHVTAGNWSADVAEARAAKDTDDLLPEGVDTPGMLLLCAENESAEVLGTVWVALDEDRAGNAWIYEIEIAREHRGRGFGRALLEAVEREVKRHGCKSIALNVFAGNVVARSLYESSGYATTSLFMRKPL